MKQSISIMNATGHTTLTWAEEVEEVIAQAEGIVKVTTTEAAFRLEELKRSYAVFDVTDVRHPRPAGVFDETREYMACRPAVAG